jgi:O-antigen/teichoic acid export membrane protein
MASSPRYVAVGAVIAGVSGYLVILIAARVLGPADYVGFSVFWSALYVLIGVLFGIQQETTRALRDALVRPAAQQPPAAGPRLVTLTLGLGGAAAVAGAATTPLWGPSVLGDRWPVLAVMIALAAVLAAAQFTVTGVLGAVGDWRGFATVVGLEGILRLAAFALVAWLIGGIEAMAWATIVVFAAASIWVFRPGGTRRRLLSPLGAPVSSSLSRFGKAMIAAGASGILINGFPAVLTALSPDVNASRLGVLILLVTLTRAPLLVPLTAFSGVLVAHFVDRRGDRGALIRPLGAVAVASLALGALAALIGPPLLPVVFGADYTTDALTVGALTVACGGLAAITVTGASALAADRHTAYVAGWLVALAACVVLLLVLPLEIEWRVVIALLGAPLVGMLPHVMRRRRIEPRPGPGVR